MKSCCIELDLIVCAMGSHARIINLNKYKIFFDQQVFGSLQIANKIRTISSREFLAYK